MQTSLSLHHLFLSHTFLLPSHFSVSLLLCDENSRMKTAADLCSSLYPPPHPQLSDRIDFISYILSLSVWNQDSDLLQFSNVCRRQRWSVCYLCFERLTLRPVHSLKRQIQLTRSHGRRRVRPFHAIHFAFECCSAKIQSEPRTELTPQWCILSIF